MDYRGAGLLPVHRRRILGSNGGDVSRRVLLIEDDSAFCEALRELLELDGCEVVSAGAVHSALEELARGEDPDLVLLDLVLPDLRETPAVIALRCATRAPVVAITALSPSSVPRDLPVEAVLFKPFSIDDVRRYLPRTSGAEGATHAEAG
jgi:CheY-like chemotaxis protein